MGKSPMEYFAKSDLKQLKATNGRSVSTELPSLRLRELPLPVCALAPGLLLQTIARFKIVPDQLLSAAVGNLSEKSKDQFLSPRESSAKSESAQLQVGYPSVHSLLTNGSNVSTEVPFRRLERWSLVFAQAPFPTMRLQLCEQQQIDRFKITQLLPSNSAEVGKARDSSLEVQQSQKVKCGVDGTTKPAPPGITSTGLCPGSWAAPANDRSLQDSSGPVAQCSSWKSIGEIEGPIPFSKVI